MGDGRFDEARLLDVAEKNSPGRASCSTWSSVAKEAGAMINAVMLGAIAGCGKLPIPVEVFEQAIRSEGKAAEANLRGFRAGLAAAQDRSDRVAPGTRRASAARSRATILRRWSAKSATRCRKRRRIS